MHIARVDLHTHSSRSDGSDTPSQLVQNAKRAGLAAVALTDHDTIDGLEEAEEAGKTCGLEVIRGVELAVQSDFMDETHILGLWVPKDTRSVRGLFARAVEERNRRNQRMVEELQAQGLALSLDEVMETMLEFAPNGMTLGRPHIAYTMFRKGLVASMREAFERYLGEGCSAYVKRDLVSPKEAIRAMADAGMTVAVAHPRLYNARAAKQGGGNPVTREQLNDQMADFKHWGMTAIEAYHSAHSAEDTRVCLELAAQHGLLLTGGSDYHGATKPMIALGEGNHNLCIPVKVLEDLKAARKKAGLPL